MTAREIIASSLRLIGVLAAGETATANEASDALNSLNQMLAVWSNENLAVYQKVREEFTLAPSTSAYTWGASGTFNSSRPIEVISAMLETGSQEMPLKILTTKEYAEIILKDLSGVPEAVYFDGAYPLLGVSLYPVPSAADRAVFYSLKPFSTLTLSTELSYPPGYEKAIRYNLALDLAPEYGRQPDALIMQQAMDAKAEIKRKNLQTPKLKMDLPTSRNTFNFEAGE
jgi:hypothetical protein